LTYPNHRKTAAFNLIQLSKAIAIRDQSYQLLMWISDAIDNQLIPPSQAERHSGGPDAATQWLMSNFHGIPTHLLPSRNNIPEFAAFFSTYLTSSFDVVEVPGTKGVGPSRCPCEVCVRMMNAPHLQTKKLYARDKRRADVLMAESLGELANANSLRLTEQQAQQLVTHQHTRRQAAYVAYGKSLIERLSGDSDGPAVLAIWRLIAWDPRGGMRPNFTLDVNDFKAAEDELLSAIRALKT